MVTGQFDSYSVSSALPACLLLDSSTGVGSGVSGKPVTRNAWEGRNIVLLSREALLGCDGRAPFVVSS